MSSGVSLRPAQTQAVVKPPSRKAMAWASLSGRWPLGTVSMPPTSKKLLAQLASATWEAIVPVQAQPHGFGCAQSLWVFAAGSGQ